MTWRTVGAKRQINVIRVIGDQHDASTATRESKNDSGTRVFVRGRSFLSNTFRSRLASVAVFLSLAMCSVGSQRLKVHFPGFRTPSPSLPPGCFLLGTCADCTSRCGARR